MENKKIFRQKCLDKRNQMDVQLRNQEELLINSCFEKYFADTPFDAYMFYASFGSEVNTFPMINWALTRNKLVFLPKVKGHEMNFYRIKDISDLTSGYRGIPEPCESDFQEFSGFTLHNLSAVMILPGVAFDIHGNRLGYGAGYYDKYLDKFDDKLHFQKMGLCYSFQVYDCIPHEPWDYKLDYLISKKGILPCH